MLVSFHFTAAKELFRQCTDAQLQITVRGCIQKFPD